MSTPEAPGTDSIVRVLEDTLLAERGTITPDQVLAELEAWDSMGIVAFVGEVDGHWSIHLSVDEILACATVSDLIACVTARA